MAKLVSAKVLRRGLEVFAGISVVGFVGLLFYGNNLEVFFATMVSLQWGWVAAGVGLASLDWFGGGLRVWVLLRHLLPKPSFKASVVSGGLGAWASYLTPSQTGGGPVMIFALHRQGTPLPEAMISILMTFVASVIFFSISGPLALFLGAGRSLEGRGILGQSVTLYDLFRISLAGFIVVGLAMLFLFAFPGVARGIAGLLVSKLESRGSSRLAAKIKAARDGIDRAHGLWLTFFKGWGWASLAAGVVASSFAFANRLLAGYVVLRMMDIHAPFVDVLLLQTLITFLLYFAPTPGGSGVAELLSLAVMSIYVPRELAPSYILLWRITVSYLTVGFGSFIFWKWLKGADGAGAESDSG
ncbi:MAG: flippase-like domain-containing protein [Gemmatimonadetes bacterium]|nr:flippase-like domain-containing protein [Gemmatimonadota bacterium]